jgi:hypothetical protein
VSYSADILTVLVASPGDVPTARAVVQGEIEGWNRSALSRLLGVELRAKLWELDSVPELGTGDAQQVLNRQLLSDADILIAVFHARLGTATARAVSGTAEEIEGAIARRLPVHVFVDLGDIPRDHDPQQLAELKAFLASLRERGLMGDFRSDDELARKVRQSLDADVGQFHRQLAAAKAAAEMSARVQPTGGAASTAPRTVWRDDLNAAADVVLGLDSLGAAQRVDGSPEWTRETFLARRTEILEGSEGLVRKVIQAVRSGDPEIASIWLDLVPTMAPNPHKGGSTVLLNLLRAPGAVLFHAGGLAACAMRDDALAGLLLTERIQVDDPYHGPRPAVVSLRADLLYESGWPSQRLHDYLIPLLAEAIGERRAGEAWERWMYLVSVATTYLGSVLPGVYSDHPYLRVSGPHVETMKVTVGAAIRREVAKAGDDGPLLTAGLCDRSVALFEEAATTFESNFGSWANSLDWQQLPGGGGILPSGPHYPGERTD